MVLNRVITSILFFGKHLWASILDRGAFVMLWRAKSKKDVAEFPSTFRWQTVWSLQETLQMSTGGLPALMEEDEEKHQTATLNPVAAAASSHQVDVEQAGSPEGMEGCQEQTTAIDSGAGVEKAVCVQPEALEASLEASVRDKASIPKSDLTKAHPTLSSSMGYEVTHDEGGGGRKVDEGEIEEKGRTEDEGGFTAGLDVPMPQLALVVDVCDSGFHGTACEAQAVLGEEKAVTSGDQAVEGGGGG